MAFMNIRKINKHAIIPTKGDPEAAGYDLYSISDITVEPWSRQKIETGLVFEIPSGYYGRIASRSSLGVNGYDIGAGVIDASFREGINIVFINSSSMIKQIQRGDRIAQIIFEKCYNFNFTEY
jgi:dUTP pyrophosphatase